MLSERQEEVSEAMPEVEKSGTSNWTGIPLVAPGGAVASNLTPSGRRTRKLSPGATPAGIEISQRFGGEPRKPRRLGRALRRNWLLEVVWPKGLVPTRPEVLGVGVRDPTVAGGAARPAEVAGREVAGWRLARPARIVSPRTSTSGERPLSTTLPKSLESTVSLNDMP